MDSQQGRRPSPRHRKNVSRATTASQFVDI